jgi:DNA primase
VLYGWVQAREGLRRQLPLVIAEGYMDVIAIHKSGVAAAVAPLGTALTPEQIVLVWKLHNEPVLCFDGDAAGQKAQMRALERFLPLLEPGKTARFATLPAGKDPDDVLREAGNEGFKNIIATARSLVDTMWDSAMAEHDVRQPEQRAQFWQSVRSQIRNIGNNQVRSAFSDEIENRIAAMRTQMRGGAMPIAARTVRRPSTGMINRHKALLALLLAHPVLISGAFETLSMLDSGDERLEKIKKAAIDALISDPDLDAEALNYHLQGLNFTDELADLTGDDMKARLPFDPATLNSDAAEAHLGELVALINGKSGVFSKSSQQRN